MRPIEVRRDQAKNGWSPNRGPGEMLLLPGTKEQFRQKTTCKSKRGKGWGLTLHILVVRQSRYRLVGGNTRAQEIQALPEVLGLLATVISSWVNNIPSLKVTGEIHKEGDPRRTGDSWLEPTTDRSPVMDRSSTALLPGFRCAASYSPSENADFFNELWHLDCMKRLEEGLAAHREGGKPKSG